MGHHNAVLLKSCGVSPGKNAVKALHKKDRQRLYHAAKKTSAKYRQQCQTLRAQKKAKADKDSYSSGAFVVSTKREIPRKKIIFEVKKQKTVPKPHAQQNTKSTYLQENSDIRVQFVVPQQETN